MMTERGRFPALLENVVHERRHSRVLEAPLAVPRRGVMLHYDDSTRDDWAVEWFRDPRCTNGYTWLVLDDGRVVELADPMKRTPHAGACRVPSANSAFYGISAATNGVTPATAEQTGAIVRLCLAIAELHDWISLPIVGHDAMAVWTPRTTREAGIADARGRLMWGKAGRKVDPRGVRKDGVPIIDVAAVRTRVERALTGGLDAAA